MNVLLEKISHQSAQISVIGLGYVGINLAFAIAKSGFKTLGIEISKEKVKCVNSGENYNEDISNEEFLELSRSKMLRATSDYSVLAEADIICICVPIPLDDQNAPDLSLLQTAVIQIKKHLRKGQLIILESTTYPGCTEEFILPLLEETNLKVGQDFYLVYSPERIDPSNKQFTLKNTPKLLGGVTPECTPLAEKFYQNFVDQLIRVSNPKIAEMAKLHENTFRAINIAFANEMAINCSYLGIDIWEVIEAAESKPFGFMRFYPGPGIGGHCIPVVPHYIRWKLKQVHKDEGFIKLSDDLNRRMPSFVVEKIVQALSSKAKILKYSKILILGAAFKENVFDYSFSPALSLMKLLKQKDVDFSYHDPYVPEIMIEGTTLKSVPLNEQLKDFDCVILITDHRCFNIKEIVKQSQLFVDTRNATKGIEGHGKIFKL